MVGGDPVCLPRYPDYNGLGRGKEGTPALVEGKGLIN